MRAKSKRMKFEIGVILIFLLFLVLSCLVSKGVIILPQEMLLKFSDEDDLFVNLFNIQATVATLSIAVIALITGFYNDTLYGISITSYIANLKPFLFKHKHLIIFDLVCVAINYVLVSQRLYNISIVLFIISISISALLVNDISIIFLSKNKIHNEIYEFILYNYNCDYINELNRDMIEHLKSGEINTFYSELDILVEIFEREVENEEDRTDIINAIEIIISSLLRYNYLY